MATPDGKSRKKKKSSYRATLPLLLQYCWSMAFRKCLMCVIPCVMSMFPPKGILSFSAGPIVIMINAVLTENWLFIVQYPWRRLSPEPCLP